MYRQIIEDRLKDAVRNLGFIPPGDTVLSIPENPEFGDYSTNIALQLAKQDTKNKYHSSQEIASAILKNFGHPDYLESVEVAGSGFINFFLKDKSLLKILFEKPSKKHSDLKILVEYAQPNTHKQFHIGHLRNISIGESIARLIEYQGVEVFRATYGGDIGPHVAKALWGVMKLDSEYQQAKKQDFLAKTKFLGKAYTLGSNAYDEGGVKKEEIESINQKIYQKDSSIVLLWEETKNWSMASFDYLYSQLGTKFDAQIWESEVEAEGRRIVEQNLNKIFIKDDGAIIFPGKKYGLHNRVFMTSKGYPTYEAKELGLTQKEQELFPYDQSLHVVAQEQTGFFQVVNRAIEEIEGKASKKLHLPHGFVTLSTGKMSSREGNVVAAEDLIEEVKKKIRENYPNQDQKNQEHLAEDIAIAAIKFSFLKYSLSSDITFNINQSVSLQGDSGPYLLYTCARIYSLLNRASLRQGYGLQAKPLLEPFDQKIAHSFAKATERKQSFENEERQLLRQLEYFETRAQEAADRFAPNIVCVHLLDLAKTFNVFYETYPILASAQEQFRIELSKKTLETLKLGLYLLGIKTVEKM